MPSGTRSPTASFIERRSASGLRGVHYERRPNRAPSGTAIAGALFAGEPPQDGGPGARSPRMRKGASQRRSCRRHRQGVRCGGVGGPCRRACDRGVPAVGAPRTPLRCLSSHGRGASPRTVWAFRALRLGPWLVPGGSSTRSAASSASLRSALRATPILARRSNHWKGL